MMLRSRKDVVLSQPLPELATAVVEQGWLDDEGLPLSVGCESTEELKQWFLDAWSEANGTRILGIYQRGTPAGFVVLEDRGERTVGLKMMVASEGLAVATSALVGLLDALFSNGVYRVEAEPLSINRKVVRAAIHFGFWKEGRKRSSKWVSKRPYDEVLLAMVKPRWDRIKRQDWLKRKSRIKRKKEKDNANR